MGHKLYLVAGETSGDIHGAALMKALLKGAPELEFRGRGGPRMRQVAGRQFHDWIHKAGVIGLWEVIKHYGFFRAEFRRALAEIAAQKPDAVVLIDYPGFNLRLARALHRQRRSTKVIYYISPQVWAWNQGRIKQIASSIDLMLCIFPFEPKLYQSSGLRAVFVGHPLSAESDDVSGDCAESGAAQRHAHLVALFPGSRQREVRKILPVMRDAALQLAAAYPHLHFCIGAASEPLAELARKELPAGDGQAKFCIKVGQTRSLMREAAVGIIASGTATLEAGVSRLPFVVLYRVAWLTYLAARLMIRVKFLAMPNVLAGREIVPEFIQHKAKPGDVARAVESLLFDESRRATVLADLDKVVATLRRGEASQNGAQAILAELQRNA